MRIFPTSYCMLRAVDGLGHEKPHTRDSQPLPAVRASSDLVAQHDSRLESNLIFTSHMLVLATKAMEYLAYYQAALLWLARNRFHHQSTIARLRTLDPSSRVTIADSIQQMMYVSGETTEPSVETTGIIEDIVRQQVIELVRMPLRKSPTSSPANSPQLKNCTELASRRGSKSISTNDLIFQIRHDQAKVSRLRTFLSWKDVRKNIKDSDDKGADADLAAGDDPTGGVGAGPVDEAAKKNKKAKVGLPWEASSFFNVEVPERDDEDDEEEEEMNYITLQRLRKADERTKAMTKEEYVTWSEYRQASFTWRKGKRFREWAGFGIVTDSKPSDDIVDILGFLTFEMVQTLTEAALKAKEQEDMARAQNGGDNAGDKKRKHQHGLFDPPSEGRTPIEPRHVQEAFRRFQQRPKKTRAMLNQTKLPQKTPLNII